MSRLHKALISIFLTNIRDTGPVTAGITKIALLAVAINAVANNAVANNAAANNAAAINAAAAPRYETLDLWPSGIGWSASIGSDGIRSRGPMATPVLTRHTPVLIRDIPVVTPTQHRDRSSDGAAFSISRLRFYMNTKRRRDLHTNMKSSDRLEAYRITMPAMSTKVRRDHPQAYPAAITMRATLNSRYRNYFGIAGIEVGSATQAAPVPVAQL